MRIRHPVACGLAALWLLAASGCGEQQTKTAEFGSTTEASPAKPASPPETARKVRKKPKIAKPQGSPPKKLVVKDLAKGQGTAVKAGDQLKVNYVGVSFKNGKEFDSSFAAGQPFDLQLGAGEVIPGWDKGIEGMKVGGRRMLTIPPDLAYGAQGQPPKIGPGETLVFVIDLLGKG